MLIQTHSTRRERFGMMAVILGLWAGVSSANACDDFAGHLISKPLRTSLEALGCGPLAKAGLTESDHQLRTVCYTSSGDQSEVKVTADLRCKTGSGAFIQSSVSESITATLTIQGSDCKILKLEFSPSDQFGELLLKGFGVDGKARDALQHMLMKAC